MVVILAGYPDKMAAMFTKNTGLKSRFKQSLEFDDWKSDELSKLIVTDLKTSRPAFAIDDEAAVMLELSSGFDRIRRGDPVSWANARDGNTMRELVKDAYYERAATLRAGSSDADAPPPAVTGERDISAAYGDLLRFFSTDTPPVEDAKEAVIIFVGRRPPPPGSLPLPFQNHGREQSASSSAQPVSAKADESEHENAVPEVGQPAAHDGGQEAEDEASFADIEAVFGLQIRKMEHLKTMDACDPHRAAVLAEIQRLERERQELIRMEKERLKLLAEEQAAREAAEKQRLHDLAMELEREKERRLQEERDKQQLQEKLRKIGRCPAGFAWKKEPGGYVCEGGFHHVSDGQLL